MIKRLENKSIIDKVWSFIYNYNDSYSFMDKSFESSCKVLNPFGFVDNGDIHEIEESNPELIQEIDWKSFCRRFDLSIAINEKATIEEIQSIFREKYGDKDFENFYWASGSLGKDQIHEIIKLISDYSTDNPIYCFYSEILNIMFDSASDELFIGQVEDILELIKSKKGFSPTVWWDKDLKWMIYSDSDLSYTNVFGDSEFIGKLIKSDKFESFVIENK
jgi:hypothetical protein